MWMASVDRGIIMTIPSSSLQYRTAALTEVATSHEIRALIAEHLGVDLEHVTDEAYFADLGADWFDRLELIMAVEDQFADVEISDEDADHWPFLVGFCGRRTNKRW